MGKFEGKLDVTPLSDGRNWWVNEPFEYWIDDNTFVRVEPGFITDFASVPRIFWNILPPWGKYGEAAVIHDHLYRTLGEVESLESKNGKKHLTRWQCDLVFRRAMKDLGVAAWKRWVMWAGVRIGGWIPWHKYKRAHHG